MIHRRIERPIYSNTNVKFIFLFLVVNRRGGSWSLHWTPPPPVPSLRSTPQGGSQPQLPSRSETRDVSNQWRVGDSTLRERSGRPGEWDSKITIKTKLYPFSLFLSTTDRASPFPFSHRKKVDPKETLTIDLRMLRTPSHWRTVNITTPNYSHWILLIPYLQSQ